MKQNGSSGSVMSSAGWEELSNKSSGCRICSAVTDPLEVLCLLLGGTNFRINVVEVGSPPWPQKSRGESSPKSGGKTAQWEKKPGQ